jgi:hypothetical protein
MIGNQVKQMTSQLQKENYGRTSHEVNYDPTAQR